MEELTKEVFGLPVWGWLLLPVIVGLLKLREAYFGPHEDYGSGSGWFDCDGGGD